MKEKHRRERRMHDALKRKEKRNRTYNKFSIYITYRREERERQSKRG